eukprot:g6078.t1
MRLGPSRRGSSIAATAWLAVAAGGATSTSEVTSTPGTSATSMSKHAFISGALHRAAEVRAAQRIDPEEDNKHKADNIIKTEKNLLKLGAASSTSRKRRKGEKKTDAGRGGRAAADGTSSQEQGQKEKFASVSRTSFSLRESSKQHPYTVTTDPNGPLPTWVSNPLAAYFFKYTSGLKIWKWHHYFQVYHRHLDPLRAYKDQRINMLVLGVQSGGEVGMWQDYFGPNLHYYGIDINPGCKAVEQRYANTKIFIGDQSDGSFLTAVKDEIVASGTPIHTILDDGSHIAWHQIASFETLYPHLHIYNGVYIVEDVTTNYANPAGNSVHRQPAPNPNFAAMYPAVNSPSETFVEHMKTRVDYVNGYWKYGEGGVNPWSDPFVTSVNDIAFYDGMVVVEKTPHSHPTQERRGSEDIPYCTSGQANGCLT